MGGRHPFLGHPLPFSPYRVAPSPPPPSAVPHTVHDARADAMRALQQSILHYMHRYVTKNGQAFVRYVKDNDSAKESWKLFQGFSKQKEYPETVLILNRLLLATFYDEAISQEDWKTWHDVMATFNNQLPPHIFPRFPMDWFPTSHNEIVQNLVYDSQEQPPLASETA